MTVESQVVFTHDGQQTIDRMATENGCPAVLIPNVMRPIQNVLVAIRGVGGIDRFVRLVSGLFATIDVSVTLYHVAEADETDEEVATLLNGVGARLSEGGVSPDLIETRIARGDDPQEMIVNAADDYDAIVMGDSDPSVATFLFGMTTDGITKRFLGLIFGLQHEKPDREGADAE